MIIIQSQVKYQSKATCIIPARMGAKRIPGKNIKKFHGIPIIVWAINLAKTSELFDTIYASTDCEKIASISIETGSSVPRLRPQTLVDHFTSTLEVIKYGIEINSLNDRSRLKNLCVLYPCTPLLHGKDLIESFKEYQSFNSNFCFSSGRASTLISRLMYINKENQISFLDDKNLNSRKQDLKEYLFAAGQFYWGKVDFWYKAAQFFIESALPYFIDRDKQIDIDTEDDWDFAEKLFLLTKA